MEGTREGMCGSLGQMGRDWEDTVGSGKEKTLSDLHFLRDPLADVGRTELKRGRNQLRKPIGLSQSSG